MRTTHSIVSPSGDRNWTLALSARWLNDPSVHIIHTAGFLSLTSPHPSVVNFAMKSTKAYALIAVLGQYWASNSPSSIAHRTSHLVASGLYMAFCSGLSFWTTMVCVL